MRARHIRRIPKISIMAMLALFAAGCSNRDASNGITPDVNAAEDAAVDDVLGANDTEANLADNNTQQP